MRISAFEAKFEGFASTWTYNGINLNSHGAIIPSKNRGQYFNQSELSYMEFIDDFYLNVDFTITSWIRVDEIGEN